MIYMLHMHCALRGGAAHNNLRRPGCNSRIKIEVDNSGKECLVYTEDPLQKTNQGGLVSKGRSKKVYVYGAQDLTRCPIRLYKKYIGLLAESKKCQKMYLRCRKNYNAKVWYCDQSCGVNKIKIAVKELCRNADLEGKLTNHALAICMTMM